MTSKANLTNFNTNIDDYSIEELYNLLELEEFTRENIIINVNHLTTNVFNNNETIKEFFLNVQTKLLTYLTHYNSSIDNMLHANANSNIETAYNNEDNISINDDDNNSIASNVSLYDNIKESFVGLNTNNTNTNNTNTNTNTNNILLLLYIK